MKNLHIFVEGDVNDGDIISRTSDISGLTKERVKTIYDKISKYNPEIDEWDREIFKYLPFLYNNELHTITKVKLLNIEEIDIKNIK